MKKSIFYLPLFLVIQTLAFTSVALSAESKTSIQTDIKTMYAPSTPAFGILDLNPSSIARPVSPKEFRASILSSIAESDSSIPGNIAIEVSPFWWNSQPDVTFERLFEKPEPWLTVKQSMSFSFATVTRDASKETESTDLSFGVRFSVFSGNLSSKSKMLNEKVTETNLAYAGAVASAECRQAREQGLSGTECPLSTSAVAKAAKKSVEDFRGSLNRRTGFQLDVASAVAYNVAANDTSTRVYKKGGLWLTASFTPDLPADSQTSNTDGGVQFLGLMRYLQEKNATTGNTDAAYDVGLRLIWRHSERPIALSLEYVGRNRDEGDNVERYAGVLEYRINDTLSFTSSIGKNFKEAGAKEDLFVLSGISFNLGKGPQVVFE